MTDRDFLNNRNISESNSLVDLMQSRDVNYDNEVNLLDHSNYYNDTDFRNTLEHINGTLRILNLNCAGLNAKFIKLKIFLAEYNNISQPISVITLQETHIHVNTDINQFNLPDYTMISDIARINDSGGVAIYVHNSFSFKRLPTDTYNQLSEVYESMIIEMYNNHSQFKKYLIGNIYRRPSERVADLTTFIDEFTEVLHFSHQRSKFAYFNGDYNIDLLTLNQNKNYNTFYENVTAQGFFPKITRPTRLSRESHSLIDNIFTNNLTADHTSGILTSHISDHFMNFCILEGRPHTIKKIKYIEVESINPVSLSNFKNSVNKADILSKLDPSPFANPNTNYNVLANILSDSKKKHIPKKLKKFNKLKDIKEKWMTNDLLILVNKKNKRYKDWKSTLNHEEYEIKKINFKTLDYLVNQAIQDAQNNYYFNTFNSQKGDMKKTWETINDTLNRKKKNTQFPSEFLVDNKSVINPADIANHFNSFFASIGSTLSSNINLQNSPITHNDYLNTPTDARFNFNTITEDQTISIINNLKNKASSGKDEISNKLLKSIKYEISRPLTVIINQSLLTGIFPAALKVAKVKPLFKKGDKTILNNYRPISLLPTISKVFERVIYNQLYNYFNVNSLLCEQQYGFRTQHSTELAAIKLIDNVITQMDSKKHNNTPVHVYLDLSKAFDTLDFDIMLKKLNYYGVKNVSLDLIESYLRHRYQYVQYNNYNSNMLEISTGIPQGSILGPLFFSIYINDIVNTSEIFSFLLYADDTTISFNLEAFPILNRELSINNELDKVNTWLKVNKLTLNVEKTKCMQFHKRKDVTNINLSINNTSIEQVKHFTFLGITLDENLTWKHHTDMITTKLSKIIGILHRLKYIYPKQILLTIYNSLFVPHINYGSLVWGTTITRLNKLQKKAIRIITHSNYLAHTEPLLKQLNLLNVGDMFALNVLKFLHKLSHQNLPPYFDVYRSHLEKITTPYYLRPHPLPVPRVEHAYAESCLVYQLVTMLNTTKQNDNLIYIKLEEKSHSFLGFSKYVTLTFVSKYKYECVVDQCYVCGLT